MIVKGPSCENKNTFGGYKIKIKDLRYSNESEEVYISKTYANLYSCFKLYYITQILGKISTDPTSSILQR